MDRVVFLGASLTTGNLGVSALLASAVRLATRAQPGAGVALLDGGRDDTPQAVRLGTGRTVELGNLGIRANKTAWKPNHLARLLFTALLIRLVPEAAWRRALRRRNRTLRAIEDATVVADITGGDSFSDIYGLGRLVMGSLRKWLVLACEKDLVLLPQTYGPFRHHLARQIARSVLARAAAVYTRDPDGPQSIRELMGGRPMRCAPRFCPDVAFTLEPIRPAGEQADLVDRLHGDGRVLVGINVSGLLYNGGYTGRNEFSLRCAYREMVHELVARCAGIKDVTVLLVPHVIPPDPAYTVENDLLACRAVAESMPPQLQENVIVLDGNYDQHEVKYLVGRCRFFAGSRMHACIAALSQCVPAAGLAYSRKFRGVFQSVDVADLVVDLREVSATQCVNRVLALYDSKDHSRRRLERAVPEVQEKVMSIFDAQ